MKILWLVNIMLPVYAKAKRLSYSEREGWLTGLYDGLKKRMEEQAEEITLGICFPAAKTKRKEVIDGVTWYAFQEDLRRPEHYVRKEEERFAKIIEDFQPDIVHLFGTEFPHTLAFVRAFEKPEHTLITLQGICTEIAKYYRADIPGSVCQHATLRDTLKRDTIAQQEEKMTIRGVRERSALLLAGHIGGRTDFDREFARKLCPRAIYHTLQETMRPAFYEGLWSLDQIRRHEIFVAQGDYPLKGLHFLFKALPSLIRLYPDIHVTVAGIRIFDPPSGDQTVPEHQARKSMRRLVKRHLPQDVKNGAYGEYLRQMADKAALWKHLSFTGSLSAEEMRAHYLAAHVMLCPSVLENSPNSVAEAMLLGVPVLASRTGGIPSMIDDGVTGLLFTTGDAKDLALKVHQMFADDALLNRMSQAARDAARLRHDPATNVTALLNAYREMTA